MLTRILFLILFFGNFLHAQSAVTATPKDSVLYNGDFKFKDGIYLTFENFRHNKPIPKSSIISDGDKNALDFLRKEIQKRIINYTDSAGALQTISPGKLWGICENSSPYIRWNSDFNKIIVIGSLCHFTASYTSYMTTGPMTGGGVNTGTPVTTNQQYVLDMKTGMVADFILPNMEIIFQRDPELYNEFMALRKGKRRDLMFFYLRKFNERNPLYV